MSQKKNFAQTPKPKPAPSQPVPTAASTASVTADATPTTSIDWLGAVYEDGDGVVHEVQGQPVPPDWKHIVLDGVEQLVRIGSDADPDTAAPTPTTDAAILPTGMANGVNSGAVTMEQMIANLRAQGFDEYADQIMLAHNEAEAVKAVVSENDDMSVVSENPDIPEVTNPTLEGEWHQYSHQELLSLICGALMGKAQQWELEAAAEMQKGAANTSMAGTLRWGAKQLTTLAGVIIQVPEGEIVFPEAVSE